MRPARQRSLRDHNLSLALRVIATADAPVSRAQIAVATGVTRATASALVDELIAGDLVHEVPLPRSAQSGRPATGIALSAGTISGLGLEINVDYLSAVVIDLTGAVVHEERVDADNRARPSTDVLRDARKLVQRVQRRAHGQVVGAAVAVPGLLRDDRLFAPNLGWWDVELRQHLAISVPTALDNEANYAALSELTPDLQSFVYVGGEIGVGAGVVINGSLFRGTRGWSGEIGHLTIDPDGPRCGCGARGCLEVYAGQATLDRSGAGAVARPLGIAIAGVMNILDIDTVVLGGMFASYASDVLPVVHQELVDRVLWSPLQPPQVVVGRHGQRAAALGAATSVIHNVLAFTS